MPDASYRNVNFLFSSKGVSARSVDDTLDQGWLLNENNCEELAENAIGNRLGVSLVNRTGTAVFPLVSGGVPSAVHSLAKLSSLNGAAFRYAGAGTGLYIRPASGQGPYAQISAAMSGQPWQSQTYGATEFTSLPYIFIADLAGMLKHNGSGAPQQMGIFQPQFPVGAVAQNPNKVTLDPAPGGTYTTSGVTSFAHGVVISPSTTLASAVTATGLQAVNVAAPSQISLYQNLTVGTGGGSEVVLVLSVTSTGFVGFFTKIHAVGAVVQGFGLSGSVQSTGLVSCAFTGKPIAGFGTTLQQADYIGLQMYISDPSNIQQIILKFDCGDGSFDSDYFYKVIGQGPLQNLLNLAAQPATASTDAIVTEALGVYGNADGSLAQLNVGTDVWTPLLIQLSDFSAGGRADFNDPTFNWNNVNGYQLTIVTNNAATGPVIFEMTSLILVGGSGPDSFAGVAYDYLFTFFNIVDGTESNPCMVMTNVNPPLQTNWVYPRRQPVLLSMNTATSRQFGGFQDPQITHVRIYRRGGTLGDNYRRVDQIAINIAAAGIVQYTDTSSDADIQENDIISFTNDVPVTSSLPVPVNTTVTLAVNPPQGGQNLTLRVSSVANMSIGQQVSIGTVGAKANNYETVIVTGIVSGAIAAYVQNHHAVGEPVTATAFYGQPVNIMAQAFNQFWFAGDSNNPHYLYYSPANSPQYVSSAAYIQVGSPDDPITAIVGFKGNLYVSTQKFWWAVAPGTNGTPTVYPTAAKHGCVAPNGWVATEEAIFYQAIDGIRAFAGGASTYLTQSQEFIFQGVGTSPIVQADPNSLNLTIMAYWNMMLYISYVGIDGHRYRLIFHQIYKRWRNDSLEATSMILEADTNTLIFGNSFGNIHIDRQNQAYDEVGTGNMLTLEPIHMDLQTPYSDEGEPSITKSYQELTLDINTNDATLNVYLWFDDGEANFLIGTVSSASRQKVNFQLNNNLGFEYYKVSLQLVGDVQNFVYAYQCSVKSLPLAKTRKTFDTFWLKLGSDESKVVKQVYIEYTSTTDITFAVCYDGSMAALYTFTLPNTNGVRTVTRVRLPAISCRMIRFIGGASADFQIWDSSRIEYKILASGKGYSVIEFVPNG